MTQLTVACQAPLSKEFSGKNTGVGNHSLLQGLLQTRDWMWSPALQVDLLPSETGKSWWLRWYWTLSANRGGHFSNKNWEISADEKSLVMQTFRFYKIITVMFLINIYLVLFSFPEFQLLDELLKNDHTSYKWSFLCLRQTENGSIFPC